MEVCEDYSIVSFFSLMINNNWFVLGKQYGCCFSVITNSVKNQENTTVKEVWIPGLN